VAYLNAIRAVERCRDAGPESTLKAGFDVMIKALEAPFSQLVENSGRFHPPLALAEAMDAGPGSGFDVASGRLCVVRENGILDSLAVVRGALQMATSAAISVIMTGAVVLPEETRRERKLKP
jgi:chaperonin GroEL